MIKRTIRHAAADVGLIFTAFNLRRIFNIIGYSALKKYLEVLAVFFCHLSSYFKPLYEFRFSSIKIPATEKAAYLCP
jgi:hypothetical protein